MRWVNLYFKRSQISQLNIQCLAFLTVTESCVESAIQNFKGMYFSLSLFCAKTVKAYEQDTYLDFLNKNNGDCYEHRSH